MKRHLKLIPFIAVMALASGCATPEPKKIDISAIPVKNSNIPATPGSIWPGESSRNALFQDLRARNVGDIVTIEITEKTSAIKEASTSTSRKSSSDIAVTNVLGLPLSVRYPNFISKSRSFSPEISESYDTSFDGEGTTKRSGELSAVISARVVQILPNGNLVLEGKKDIMVNNELQFIVISGIARPEDINDANMVASTALSDGRIEYSGNGVIADEQRPGWLRRILDNVWPF